MGHVILTTPLLGVICHDVAYLCTKFDDSSYRHSRDMIKAPKIQMGDVTSNMSLSAVVCRQWAKTYYDQPTYQIFSFYIHPLRRMYKIGWFGVVGVIKDH